MGLGISNRLSMQVAQRLEMAMTPQMIQSMELLQMPLMQLEQRLRQEQLENPVLELADIEALEGEGAWDGDPAEAEEGAHDDQADSTATAEESNVFADSDQSEGLERVDDVDFDWNENFDDYSPRQSANSDDEERFDPIANAQARPPSLVEHLLRQLSETPMPDRTRRLAAGMAQKLDANGWLTVPLVDCVPEGEEAATQEELDEALRELQKLSPDGIGARNLAECLLLQLRDKGEADEVVVGLIHDHLDDLAANRLPKIAKKLKCSLEDVKRAAATIRSLNPRPGADFSSAAPLAVRPELIVDGTAQDGFTVRLASGAQPQVSDFFIALFDRSRRGKIVRERIEADPGQSESFRQFQEQMRRSGLGKKFRDKYNNAQWLVKAVAQREKTLLTVAEAIVEAQHDYLAELSPVPAPLLMQDIADKVGYDISTVSRAVRDKYIDTPLGIKLLKDFFSRASGVAEAGEEAESSASVLQKMRQMIEGEDKSRPIRDNEIMERLAAEGVKLKRRSIVNYRKKLGFPSHSQRKEH